MTAGKYFNRGVIALDAPHIGFEVRELVIRLSYLVNMIIGLMFLNPILRLLAEMLF